jgi:hypothetical protein
MCASDAPNSGGTSAQHAQEACAVLLDGFGGGLDLAALPDTLIQRLLTLAVGAYAAKLDAGAPCRPFAPESRLTASEVCPVVARMLRAVDVDLFELAMWQHLVDG